MNQKKLYRETFSRLHASGDTITEVLNMAHEYNERKTNRP